MTGNFNNFFCLLQSNRKIGPNWVCIECSVLGSSFCGNQSQQRHSFGHRKQAKVDSLWRAECPQNRKHHQQYWNDLLWNGAWLSFASETSQKNGPRLWNCLRRINSNFPASSESCWSDARIYTIRRSPTIRCIIAHLWNRRWRSIVVPVWSFRSLFRLESNCHGQELHKWKDFPGKTVSEFELFFSSNTQLIEILSKLQIQRRSWIGRCCSHCYSHFERGIRGPDDCWKYRSWRLWSGRIQTSNHL